MENPKMNTLDELSRLLLPSKFTNHLCFEKGSALHLIVNTADRTIEVIQVTQNILADNEKTSQLDELNRITINKEMRDVLGWQIGNCITVSLDTDGARIRLKASA